MQFFLYNLYSAKVVNESEALRWVTEQWENWTEKYVISDVYEICETFTRTDAWWETIPDGRSSSTESASAK